jgi:hypothetical protein
MKYPLEKSEAQWKEEWEKKNTVSCVKGTERPHTGTYNFTRRRNFCCGVQNHLFQQFKV